MGYCLTWELAGARAPEHWAHLRAEAGRGDVLTELERWSAELYEEGPPSAQEERSLLSRIECALRGRRQLEAVKRLIVDLLPDVLHPAATRHSLLQGLRLRREPSVVETWLKRTGFGLAGDDGFPDAAARLGEREADFSRFLSLPGFEEQFRAFWRREPKLRGNRQTRALVTIGALAGQCIRPHDGVDWDRWAARFAGTCHYSIQTQQDVLLIAAETSGHCYDAQELAYRLLADARPQDIRYLKEWIARHEDEMNPIASELRRLLNL